MSNPFNGSHAFDNPYQLMLDAHRAKQAVLDDWIHTWINKTAEIMSLQAELELEQKTVQRQNRNVFSTAAPISETAYNWVAQHQVQQQKGHLRPGPSLERGKSSKAGPSLGRYPAEAAYVHLLEEWERCRDRALKKLCQAEAERLVAMWNAPIEQSIQSQGTIVQKSAKDLHALKIRISAQVVPCAPSEANLKWSALGASSPLDHYLSLMTPAC
ncbi:hypothetical protein JCM11491_004267 [Sporobolomyces phaffii]